MASFLLLTPCLNSLGPPSFIALAHGPAWKPQLTPQPPKSKRPSSLALQLTRASVRLPRFIPDPVSWGVGKRAPRAAGICSQGDGRFQRRRPRNSTGVSTTGHPNKISWSRKDGLCGKNWGRNWITEVDQLKAQQHYVQYILGKREPVL